MTKFTLIIWVCSFLGSQPSCLPPVQYPHDLKSWYECSRTAHKESLIIISKMGFKYINDNKIAMSYSCREVTTI
jgi:hypothetical protein